MTAASRELLPSTRNQARHHLGRCPRRIGSGKAALNNVAGHLLSTQRRQTGILMDVLTVLRESPSFDNLCFLGRGRMDNVLKAHS